MKRLRSIRWQLPATYAAIALLTALALGGLLLGMLNMDYRQRESDLLQANATLVRENLSALIAQSAASDLLSEQVRTLAFLTQTRIRLRGPNGELLVDSSVPRAARLEVILVPAGEGLPGLPQQGAPGDGEQIQSYAAYIRIHPLPEAPAVPSLSPPDPDEIVLQNGEFPRFNEFNPPVLVFPEQGQGRPFALSGINTAGSLFGNDLGSQGSFPYARSSLSTSFALIRPVENNPQMVGTVELSEGPALGSEILRSVALAVAAAGVLAVILGGLVGWLVSSRINRPLLALAAVTERMASGDLESRAVRSGPNELSRLADAFNQMAARVADLVITLRRFVADAAHQINTPLTTLRVALDYLAPELKAEDQRRVLAKAQAQVMHLERLAAALLSLSRLENREPSNIFQPVDLVSLLAPLTEEYASRAEQAGLELNLDMPEEVLVSGDREELSIAIANLLDNAVKFTPSGGQVSVQLRIDGGWAELSITDNGIGIPLNDLAMLFSRFHRAQNAAAYPGTGLGLAIVAAVAKHHSGQVTVVPHESGTMFCFRIPLC